MAHYKKKVIEGVRIKDVDKSSLAYSVGIRKGDYVIAVNSLPVEDELDFNFYTASEKLTIQIRRKDKRKVFSLSRKSGQLIGIEFCRMPIKRCRNKCIFCFIDQLPDGLRKSLYVKDEDYRYSFLNGNYITLSGISQREMKRIIQIGLSPLYISVHSTDPDVRIRMLNNRRAGEIVPQLKRLEDSGIGFHAQIVVCPDINDGAILKRTMRNLLGFKKGLLSIAVVPVGLTKHRKSYLKPVSTEDALGICKMVDILSEQDRKTTGKRRLFIADEFLLKAGLEIPESGYYEEYPQIENGVGLISVLLDEWKDVRIDLQKRINEIKPAIRRYSLSKKKRYLIITSVSAQSFLKEIVTELGQIDGKLELFVEPVINRFFGETVTVAGLITARDIIKTVSKFKERWDAVIIPHVILNYNGYTLDGFSTTRIAQKTDNKIEIAGTISELIDCILKK